MVEIVVGRCAAFLVLLALLNNASLISVSGRIEVGLRKWRHPVCNGRGEKMPEDPNGTFQETLLRRDEEVKVTTEKLPWLEGEGETVHTRDGNSCGGKNAWFTPEMEVDYHRLGRQITPPPDEFLALLEKVINILDKHLKSDLEKDSSEGFQKSLNLLKETFRRDELIRDLERGLTEESLVKDPGARNVQSWQVLVHYIRYRMHKIGSESLSESINNSWRRLQEDWKFMRRRFPEVPKFLFSKDGTIKRKTDIWNGGEFGDTEPRVEVTIDGGRRLNLMHPYQLPPGVYFVRDL